MKSTYYYEQDIVGKMLNLLSSQAGLINDITIKKCVMDKKNITHGNIPNCYISSITTNITKNLGMNLGGSGASISKNRSIIKAIGEFIERYCALENSNITNYDSIKSLDSKNIEYIDIREFIHFSDDQYQEDNFPFKKYNSEDNIYWVDGYNVTNKCNVFIPAQKVYLNYRTDKEEYSYDTKLSTGLACGDSLENALLSGLYECIERDAFYLTWSCKLPGKKIILNNIKDYNLKKLIDILDMSSCGTLHIVDISLDTSVYTMLTVLENKSGVGISVAAASNLNPELAILKSLEELVLTYSGTVNIYENKFNSKYPDIYKEDILDLDDHIYYYMNPNNNKALEFITRNENYINSNDLKNNSLGNASDNLELIVNELNKLGAQVIYKDITNEEINQLGFSVVKVLSTKLGNIDVMYSARHLGTKRMLDIINYDNSKVNIEPHPFP
ncbi:MAG: YcaO-like family protein [Terrisporobacter sp.]